MQTAFFHIVARPRLVARVLDVPGLCSHHPRILSIRYSTDSDCLVRDPGEGLDRLVRLGRPSPLSSMALPARPRLKGDLAQEPAVHGLASCLGGCGRISLTFALPWAVASRSDRRRFWIFSASFSSPLSIVFYL